MRTNGNEELVLFGRIEDSDSNCNGFSTDGQELLYEKNASILTLSKI